MAIKIDFFEDVRKQVEKFSLNFFKTCNPFSSWPSSAKDICKQSQYTNKPVVNKNSPLFVGFLRHKYMFWLFKEKLKISDRAPLSSLVRE